MGMGQKSNGSADCKKQRDVQKILLVGILLITYIILISKFVRS